MSAAIDAWRRLMNAGDFFAAHEALEHAWITSVEPEKTFLKGLIHAAVALHHYQRHNGHGARVKFASALRYLAPYPDAHLGVPVECLRRQMREFFAPLVALPKGAAPPPATQWPRIG
ncbi:MAG: DUF309 domain-containing protein [Actinomycetota bacterium]